MVASAVFSLTEMLLSPCGRLNGIEIVDGSGRQSCLRARIMKPLRNV